MEAKLESVLDNMMQNENTIGAVITDSHGLCYGTRGNSSGNSSGLISAIADQAAKIHPNIDAPVVILESADKSVSISKHGFYTGAVYKSKSSPKK
ncbi:CLUMA_CG014917, isoform A [Clunio marinus]|uniref:Late endosomal/lysosomal adaptor and MAPK and MTOR activator 5 n=1 Tax=Clunio marinus TaxID=568069 RepID=A0A1J1IN97_9DIPT|nr:CLUMA_CG014917, isoform A [Clunio marinus]